MYVCMLTQVIEDRCKVLFTLRIANFRIFVYNREDYAPKKARGMSVDNQIALKFNCGFARVTAYELFVNKRYVKSKYSTIAREVNHFIALH